MPVCHNHCSPPCGYGCGLRQKGVAVAPSATPTRMNNIPPPKANPAWERGRISESRPGGERMPVFAPGTLRPLGVKEYSERKREIDSGLRRNKSSTT